MTVLEPQRSAVAPQQPSVLLVTRLAFGKSAPKAAGGAAG
jgi:hypothetical protein